MREIAYQNPSYMGCESQRVHILPTFTQLYAEVYRSFYVGHKPKPGRIALLATTSPILRPSYSMLNAMVAVGIRPLCDKTVNGAGQFHLRGVLSRKPRLE